MGRATVRANRRGRLWANTLGMISPKSSSRKVAMTDSKKAHAGRAEREEQVDDACGQDDDADVHQIVDHQNRSEQLIDVAEQPQNGVVRRFFGMCLDVPYVVRREREKRRLGARNEGRDCQQAHRDRSRQEQTDVYGVECDQTTFQIRLFSFCTACRRISRRASRPSPAEVSPRRRPPP